MSLLFYTLNSKHTNAFDKARFNLIWRVNYVLSILFVFLILAFLVQGDLKSFFLFTFSLLITSGSLYYLFKTENYKPIYYFIVISGLTLCAFSINIFQTLIHYGDLVWLIVAVALGYFGLGSKIAKYFLLVALVEIAVHIVFFLNSNIEKMAPLNTIDMLPLILEISIAFFIVFYIISQYTSLYTSSEQNILAINRELEYQNKIVSKQNNDKELLLKEIHHRVKNNLQIISSLLNLQSYSIENETALSAIKEGQSRIKTMALLHQRLYQNTSDFSKLNFNDYVKELVDNIRKNYSGNQTNVQILINIDNFYFDIDTAVPLGLIINELCSNSFKYALGAGGKLEISIKQIADNNYILRVKDSGLGIDESKITTPNSMGLKLVTILARQLKGSLKYTYDSGANFLISFFDTSHHTTQNEN
ncbi:MAG: sensor histidine kinase [Bacteroidetes bacterium]|nr:sensor histidine kinase [Bacteroidota bacterium]